MHKPYFNRCELGHALSGSIPYAIKESALNHLNNSNSVYRLLLLNAELPSMPPLVHFTLFHVRMK